MELIINSVEDKDSWEKFLLQNSPQALFQSWLWGEVQKKLGNTVWRLGVYRDKQLEAVAQVVKVPARRGQFLHIRHGPVTAGENKLIWELLFNFCKDLGRKERCWFVRFSPLVEPNLFFDSLIIQEKAMPAQIHAMDAELCWILDLDKPLDALLAQMRKSTRYEIRRAQSAGVQVQPVNTKDGFRNFVDLYKLTAKRQAFVPHAGLSQEFELFSAEGKADLFIGKYQGELIAGALILYYGNQAIYHHGASIPCRAPVSTLVQWAAITKAKGRGLKYYNFWGIAPPGHKNHPWHGLTVFKMGFGGHEARYLHAHDLPLDPRYLISRSVELVRKKVKGY